MLRPTMSVAAAAAVAALVLVPGVAVSAAPASSYGGEQAVAPAGPVGQAVAPPRALVEDQNTAGYSVDTAAETGVYRSDLVMPSVTCAEAADGGLYPHLTVAGGFDHTYARVFMLFSCFDGILTTDFVVDGSGGDYRPTLAMTPGDPLRWIIRDEVDSATVVVRNLATDERQRFPLGVISPGWAAVGQGVPWPGAPAPAFDGYGGFSHVRLGGTAPATWTLLDVLDTDGTTLLRSTSTGRRSFDVEAVIAPPPPPPPGPA